MTIDIKFADIRNIVQRRLRIQLELNWPFGFGIVWNMEDLPYIIIADT